MARPFEDLILSEGLTDLGTFDIDVTSIEVATSVENPILVPSAIQIARTQLFKLQCDSSTDVVPSTYRAVFTVSVIGDEPYSYTQFPNSQGYIQIETPVLPIAVLSADGTEKQIQMLVHGELDTRSEECYLKVSSPAPTMYTQITDLAVSGGYLCVADGQGHFYRITSPSISIGSSITAIYISRKGKVYGYNHTESAWNYIETLSFNAIQHPENLAVYSDGFYTTTGTTGTITSGGLGVAGSPFEHWSASINSPEPYYLNANLKVYADGSSTPFYTGDFLNLMPGGLNYTLVEMTCPVPAAATSPSLTDIQAVSGVTFTNPFLAFLTTKGLTTISSIQKSGPITFINDYPTGSNPTQVSLLQSHVDLWMLNQNLNQNQHVISSGYTTVFKIATTEKSKFLADVVGSSVPLFDAAALHEVAAQGQKFMASVISGTLSDYRLVESPSPQLAHSSFSTDQLSASTNVCGCSDCQSMISPFAYLMDLLKYCAQKIDYSSEYNHETPNYTTFINKLTAVFHQPFGTMDVNCDTLHDEYCRVRLVTEILEILVSSATLSPTQTTTLNNAVANYLKLVYVALLKQIGTSLEELRNVVNIPTSAEKLAATEKWANRIGIPTYVPTTSTLTSDRLWLTVGATVPTQVLNAANLEDLFGYRNTGDSQTAPTASAKLLDWKNTKLKELWKAQDYLITDFSREDLSVGYKSNWQPIVDPDLMSWSDMTYGTPTAIANIYKNRKKDVDSFLYYCADSSTVKTNISADLTKRILKVVDRDIVNQTIKDDEINITNGTSTSYYAIQARQLVNTDTNVVLKVDATPMINPDSTTVAHMRYTRVLEYDTAITGGSTSASLIWGEPSLIDQLSGGLATFTYGATIYKTAGSSNVLSVTYISNTQVNLTFSPALPATVTTPYLFTYEVEVPLYTEKILDPARLISALFTTNNFLYTLTSPATSGITNPFPYTLWANSTTWPSGITAPTQYGKLKQLYQAVLDGSAPQSYFDKVSNDLHCSISAFNRIMELFAKADDYMWSCFTNSKPELSEYYEMASYLRTCARASLRATWVKEEVEYIPSGGTQANTVLSSQFFWKALSEPLTGSWDPTLQTIPDTLPTDYSPYSPIIDPELLDRNELLDHPIAAPFVALYDARKTQLQTLRGTYSDYISGATYYPLGFEAVLNHINTGSPTTAYNIAPYLTFEDLLNAITSDDNFVKKSGENVAWSAFRMKPDEFIEMATIKAFSEQTDPLKQPNASQISRSLSIFVTASKRKRLYPPVTSPTASDGWIKEEITGSLTGGVQALYYNILQMKAPAGRFEASERIEWQRTLAAWSRLPFVDPDLLPPENILDFFSGFYTHDTWISRKSAETTLYSTLNTVFTSLSPNTNATLLTRITQQIDHLIARDGLTSLSSSTPYFHYFTDIKTIEAAGEDITALLEQLGFTIAEYRCLRKIYDYVSSVSQSAAPSLLPEEYDDMINIIIQVQKRSLSYNKVYDEYSNGITFTSDFFILYEAPLVNFPQNSLQVVNSWRFSLSDQRDRNDTLEGRIERLQAIKSEWVKCVENVEDVMLPYLRDAYIEALRNNCETFNNAADRLSKTYFIETRDNCCVKHTRVSFAIETIQGLVFALHNGIYDEYSTGFSLFAPYFAQEWQWIGSYETWRSAVFVFIYPENLLYPTLKRLQSPKFQGLSDKLLNATRFTPDDACSAASDFDQYFSDIHTDTLEIVSSTTAWSRVVNEDPTSCCNTDVPLYAEYTYFIGHSNVSGISYWSKKATKDDSSNSMTFWEQLPLPEGATPLGCKVIVEENYENWLWLFFSYRQSGKLKLAYLTRNINQNNQEWKQEDTDDIPELVDGNITFGAQHIIASQMVEGWNNPGFIVTYNRPESGPNGRNYFHAYIQFERFSHKFKPEKVDFSLFTVNQQSNPLLTAIYNNQTQPLTCITLTLWNNSPIVWAAVAIFFQDMIWYNGVGFACNGDFEPGALNDTFVGAYEDTGGQGKLIIVTQATTGLNYAVENSLTCAYGTSGLPYLSVASTATANIATSDQTLQYCKKIADVYSDNNTREKLFVTEGSTFGTISQSIEYDSGTSNLTSDSYTRIALWNNGARELIQSADCISDMLYRKMEIELYMPFNMNAPLGTVPVTCTCQNTLIECMREAYYSVPLLLALDQQQRGQYPSALSWYRTIYDYTQNLASNRKIYYGLETEASISNTYTYASSWWLDPLNPHSIALTRANSHTKYTLLNIIECLFAYADQQFTMDTVETVPQARMLYTAGLDLLKVPEVLLKPNACIDISSACLASGVVMNSDPAWSNMFLRLQSLLNLYPANVIQTRVNAIISIFNGTGTIESKFTSAFDYLNSNPPPSPTSSTISAVMADLGQTMSNAYRYFTAVADVSSFNQAVLNNYRISVGNISALTPAQVSSGSFTSRMAWLNEPMPVNGSQLAFEFSNSSGIQNLPAEFAYNPLSPVTQSLVANASYSNAQIVVNYQPNQLPAIVHTPLINYSFCLPLNPVFNSLLLKGNLELYKIFNCRNIAGMVRELDPYAAATDSVTGMPVIGASGSLSLPGASAFSPSQYRYSALIERAKVLVSQSQQLESMFLSAMEKQDAENYNQLLARQGIENARATVKLQDLRITMAEDEKNVSTLQRDKAAFSKKHFSTLIANGLNAYEINALNYLSSSIDYMNTSIGYQMQAIQTNIMNGVYQLNAIAGAVPLTTTLTAGAFGSAAAAFNGGAGIASTNASISSTMSSISAQLASFERREQDWKFQQDLAEQDIDIANAQIKVADDNVRIVTQEREVAQINLDHAYDTLQFLQNKFTNAALYGWMSGVLQKCYSFMLNLSTSVAKTAEKQLLFERQEQAGPFILNDYWEMPSKGSPGASTDRMGLTGSARLLTDITKLDQYAFDSNKNKLKMTKVISLGTMFPVEFQRFRETGILSFQLTNKMFDYDFPGHYLRLITDVKTTVVGLVPVNEGVKATLSAGTISYTVTGGQTFQKTPIKRLQVPATVLTGMSNGNGISELQQTQSDLLLPFEGMGIESQWEFSMPQFSNRFDFENIADVVMVVNYTALDSYLYRYQVLQQLDNRLSFNRAFSFRNNFPDQWYELSGAEAGDISFGVTLDLKRDYFPSGVNSLQINKASDILLYFSRNDEYTNEITILDFSLNSAQTTNNNSGGTTINGKFNASQLSNTIGNSPVVKLKLLFENTLENRKMFSDGSITDILLVVPCKVELKDYPM